MKRELKQTAKLGVQLPRSMSGLGLGLVSGSEEAEQEGLHSMQPVYPLKPVQQVGFELEEPGPVQDLERALPLA